MKNENEQVLKTFYTAFQNGKAEDMVALYHDEIVFEDPAFGTLKGERAKDMWRMLCGRAKDLQISFEVLNEQSVRWEALYTFNATGKKVHNIIHAQFEFKERKIVRHKDSFNLHKWAFQALGFKGWLLGWTSFFQKKIINQTNLALSKFSSFKE